MPSAPVPDSYAETVSTTDASRACLAELRSLAGGAGTGMEHHCLRAFEIACELGRRRGAHIDREALLCAAWLHDAGLYPAAASRATYVEDGRRLAQRVLARYDWPAPRLALVGDAIEMHHDMRSQWSRGTEVELLRRADLIDVSGGLVRFGLDRPWLKALFARVPRDGMYAEISRLLRRALRERPASLPAIFLRRH